MVCDFASRPPELNSALIYSGAGAGPLLAAVTAVTVFGPLVVGGSTQPHSTRPYALRPLHRLTRMIAKPSTRILPDHSLQ
jgi:hypothetical protein